MALSKLTRILSAEACSRGASLLGDGKTLAVFVSKNMYFIAGSDK
jgi:hypothetical protein